MVLARSHSILLNAVVGREYLRWRSAASAYMLVNSSTFSLIGLDYRFLRFGILKASMLEMSQD